MGRTPRIPVVLKHGPFTFREAVKAGITHDSLKGKAWRRLGAELYCWSGWQEDPWFVLAAWTRLLPLDAVFAESTAAWLWGINTTRLYPLTVILAPESTVRTRTGLNLRRWRIDPEDIGEVRGLRATTVHRTLCDVSAQWSRVDALAAIDAALHLGHASTGALARYADLATGRRGARQLGELIQFAAPAESPMETRLRWLLVEAGLPRPAVQADLRDPDGRFVGRADLYYPQERLVIEYDGLNHRDRLTEDNRRQNLLVNAGFSVLRFTAADFDRPHAIVSQIRSALRQSAELTPKPRNLRPNSAVLASKPRNPGLGLFGS